MELKQIRELRAKSNLPINRLIKDKQVRGKLADEIIEVIHGFIGKAEEVALGEETRDDMFVETKHFVLSLKDLCQEMGLRPTEFMAICNEFPDVQEAYDEYRELVELTIEDKVSVHATAGDVGAITLYHKYYSKSKRDDERLRLQMVKRSLSKIRKLRDTGKLTPAAVKNHITELLLEAIHVSMANGNMTNASVFTEKIIKMLNLAELIDLDSSVENMSITELSKLAQDTLAKHGVASTVSDDRLVEAIQISPAYADILPTDKNIGVKLKNLGKTSEDK